MLPAARRRAALLCLGGWGLHTLLHLLPRLSATQEARAAVGLDARLPDLHRLTTAAAVAIAPLVHDTPYDYRPFALTRINPARLPAPFTAETLLRQADEAPAESRLTAAESQAAALFAQAHTAGHLHYLPVTLPVFGNLPARARPSRAAMFEMAMACAPALAHSLRRHTIDPTRLDDIQPHEPLIHTSLYVVGSLAEPGVSALLWPLLAELLAAPDTRHLLSVTALLQTGSFALDETHRIEEAATYTALLELEALMGAAAPPVCAIMRQHIEQVAPPHWAARTGERLCERIYLIDREKSNHALARDANELAVLAANAIEALLVAGGEDYIETQLGPDAHGILADTYSLIGAASCYVPLAPYIAAAVHEERQRIVRADVLAPGEPAGATLHDLGITPGEVVRRLRAAASVPIFEPESLRPPRRRRKLRLPRWRKRAARQGHAPDTDEEHGELRLPVLRVARTYIFPPGMVRPLHSAHELLSWCTRADLRADAAEKTIHQEIESGLFAQEWGLGYHQPIYHDDELARVLDRAREQTWTMRHQGDTRALPAAMLHAIRATVADICRAPHGIMQAHERLHRWIDEVDRVLAAQREAEWEQARQEPPDHAQAHNDRWRQMLARATAREPRGAAIAARCGLLWLFATYVLFLWLDREIAPMEYPLVAALLARTGLPAQPVLLVLVATGCALVALLAWWLVTEAQSRRIEDVQEERMTLAQRHLSRRANRIIRQNLYRVYQQLGADLETLRAPLRQAIGSLEEWATPAHEGMPECPPAGIEGSHLRQAHITPHTWQHITTLIHEQRSHNQHTSQEHFRAQWAAQRNLPTSWYSNGTTLAQQARLRLELPLNEHELEHLLRLTARWQRLREQTHTRHLFIPETYDQAIRGISHQLEQDQQTGAWCAYAAGPPGAQPAPRCSACANPEQHGCPFSAEGATRREAWSLAALYHDALDQASAHVHSVHHPTPQHRAFIRQLYQSLSLETLLAHPDPAATLQNGAATDERTFSEDMYARARPAASYDLSGAVAHHTVEVAFATTAEAPASRLRAAFEQRQMTLLSSHDPLTIAAVRTLHGLHLHNLMLSRRCAAAYSQLDPDEQAMLHLARHPADNERLYARQGDTLAAHHNPEQADLW